MRKCNTKRCGLGCTQEDYDRTVYAADKLVEHLGKGWIPCVHENLGWFASAKTADGVMSVSAPYGAGKTYCAFFGYPGSGGGKWSEHGDTPKGAVQAVVAKAQAERDEITTWLEAFEEAIR